MTEHSIHDDTYCTECRNLCYPWEPCNCCRLTVEAPLEEEIATKDKKIAELEAELAEYRSAEHIYGKHFAERAEKAEAEVERLQAYRRLDSLSHSDDCPCGWPVPSWVPRGKSWDCPICSFEGGGRETEPLSAKPRENGVSPSPPVDSATLLAKARAAERKKPRVEPPFRRSAARKERDP